LDEAEQVGGGFWGLLILAVACAVLLEHD
jgi:hypothetical protein